MAKKLFYKIGEACKLLDIQPYVLRYWETEFPFLNPGKSKSGQRVYSEREVEVIRRIKGLLYDEGYTIAGAKKKLEAEIGDLLTDLEAPTSPQVLPLFALTEKAPAAEVPEPTPAVEMFDPDDLDLRPIAFEVPAVAAPATFEALDALERVDTVEPEPEVEADATTAEPIGEATGTKERERPKEPWAGQPTHDPVASDLDFAARQRVETLHAGLLAALTQARDLLALLDAAPVSSQRPAS